VPAGLGGGGWLAIKHETTMGTYLPPSTAGTIWVPILSESFMYTEDKYYSPQIRQQTIVSSVEPSYYHVEGDVEMEVDPNFLPYFLYCSRHTLTKTGAATPWVYKAVPSQAGSASTAAGPTTAKTASITVVRNGLGFGYAGCVVNNWEFTIEDGVLRATLGMLGLSEEEPAGLGSPTWLDPVLFGADTHNIYVAASGAAPTFVTPVVDFNGFTFTANYNGEAQNRIRADRAASYISFGETEATYDTELDFLSRAEYENYKNATTRAIRLGSYKGGATLAAATSGFELDVNRTAYDSYEVGLAGMGDLIMASVSGRALGVAGGAPYSISCKSETADIT
jgi:Phage tail tube protein